MISNLLILLLTPFVSGWADDGRDADIPCESSVLEGFKNICRLYLRENPKRTVRMTRKGQRPGGPTEN